MGREVPCQSPRRIVRRHWLIVYGIRRTRVQLPPSSLSSLAASLMPGGGAPVEAGTPGLAAMHELTPAARHSWA